jgi:hypothetical protein
MRSPRQAFIDWMIAALTRPRKIYHRYGWNDLDHLKKHVRKADVILIDGDQRISQAIKSLTTSSWSHNCVYIGDEIIPQTIPCAGGRGTLRPGVPHLVIEALVDQGVIVSPLSKYADFNIRICRPYRLRPEDARIVIDDLISKIGLKYDIKNFVDLARYLLPFHLIPARFREDALHLGSGQATETICSSMTAAAFQKVGFPILPIFRPEKPKTFGERVKASLLGRRSRRAYTGIFHARHPTLVVPRDFDLSPFFEIVKFNRIEDGTFDYRRMRWDADDSTIGFARAGSGEDQDPGVTSDPPATPPAYCERSEARELGDRFTSLTMTRRNSRGRR